MALCCVLRHNERKGVIHLPRQTLKKRPDGRYVCKYKGFSFYGRTQSEALAAREEYKKQEKYGRKPREKYTFAEYAAEWLPTYKSNVAINTYNKCAMYLTRISRQLPQVPLAEITSSDIKKMYNNYNHLMDSTRKKVESITRAVFRTARNDGLIVIDPCENVHRDKGENGTHRNLEAWEIRLIEETYQEESMGLLAMAMLYSGMRKGEALAIDIDRDIDFENGYIHIRKAIRNEAGKSVLSKTKTKAGVRDVPLFPPLRKALEGKHGALMKTRTGTYIREETENLRWHAYVEHLSKKAGRTVKIRQHDLRHTFATMLYDADVDIKTAVKWMGHANEQMILRIYAHLTQKKEESAIARMNKMLTNAPSGQNGSQPKAVKP